MPYSWWWYFGNALIPLGRVVFLVWSWFQFLGSLCPVPLAACPSSSVCLVMFHDHTWNGLRLCPPSWLSSFSCLLSTSIDVWELKDHFQSQMVTVYFSLGRWFFWQHKSSKTYLPMHSVPVQLQVSWSHDHSLSYMYFLCCCIFISPALVLPPLPPPTLIHTPISSVSLSSLSHPVLSELQFIPYISIEETTEIFFPPLSWTWIYSKPVLWLDLDTLIHSRAIIVGGMTAPLIWFLSQDWVLIKDLLSFIFIYLLS